MNRLTQRQTNETARTTTTTTTTTTSKPTFHKYNNETLADKELYGTTRTLYNVMLALSNIHTHELCKSVPFLAACICKSPYTARRHLDKLVAMGYVTRIFRKSKDNPRWNLPNIYVVHEVRIKKPEIQSNIETNDGIVTKMIVPPIKNLYPKDKRDSLRESNNITLTREAEKLPKKTMKKKTPFRP